MVVKGVRSKDSAYWLQKKARSKDSAYWLQKKRSLRIVHTDCKSATI